MGYLTSFLLGVIGGLLFSIFLLSYSKRIKQSESSALPKKNLNDFNNNNLDTYKITKELEELKKLYQESHDLAEAEREFYENNN